MNSDQTTDKTFYQPAIDPDVWMLDPDTVFLNHGSFGSCPRVVLDFQRSMQWRMERQPIQFFVRDLEGLLDQARSDLAQLIHAEPDNLVFVPNATYGVNTVLRSLPIEPGDELVVTNHEYNACRNAVNVVAEQSRAKVVVAEIPFPLKSEDQIVSAVLNRISKKTRIVLVDHISSQTGMVFPIEQLVNQLNRHGIDTLIDGAHAPGMVPLDLARIGAAYYTGNCHKWLCAPKGAGFLHVRPDRRSIIRPLSISHGANSPRHDRSRYLVEFGWTGTWDPSAWLTVPESIRFMASLLPGGWPDIMRRNRQLALAARRIICRALCIDLPCPDDRIGSLAAFPLPDAATGKPPSSPLYLDPLQEDLLAKHRIEVPIMPWPEPPHRLIRISCQLYNHLGQYELLADALQNIFE